MQSYLSLLSKVLYTGQKVSDRTGVGTYSLSGESLSVDLNEGFPLLTTKRVPFRWVAEELFWFLSGSTNEHDLADRHVDIWKEWATPEQCAKFGREPGDLGPVYGRLWTDFDGVDQIRYVVHEMHHNPNSRRIICSGWHPVWQSQVALPPCHTLWQIKCWPNDSADLILYARSIDIFLGLPFNVASYALLLHLLCATTGKRANKLTIHFGDLHLYTNHVEAAKEQLLRKPYVLPRLIVKERRSALRDYRWSDIEIVGYQHHPKIEAEVAV